MKRNLEDRHRVEVYVTDEEIALIREAAERAVLSMSRWALPILLERARAEVQPAPERETPRPSPAHSVGETRHARIKRNT